MDEFHVNDRVTIVGKNLIGTIAFIGNTSFSDHLWLWIILDESVARNNESYEGVWYFKCGNDHGIFAHPSQVKKVSFAPLESEAENASSRKSYTNYLRYDSLMKLKEKQNSYEKNSILLKKIKKDIAMKSTSIPFFSSDGDAFLHDNNLQMKPKSITQSEKYLTETQFSQQEKEAKDSFPHKGTRMQVFELKDMSSKTSNDLNEVKDNIPSLGRKTQTLKHFPGKQFSQQEKETKDSSSD
ncbi:hypothetical protein AVEN_89187-1, partial [Araneus ventricosus]